MSEIIVQSAGLKDHPGHGGPNISSVSQGDTLTILSDPAWVRVQMTSGAGAGKSGWLPVEAIGTIPPPPPPPPTIGSRILCADIQGAGQSSGGSAIDAFNSLVYSGGKRVPGILYFLDTSSGWGTIKPIEDNIYARGAVPILTWQPQDRSVPGNAASVAAAMKADGRSRLIRFGHEMNGGWYPWHGLGPDGYKNMFRQTVQAFRNAGARNVKWVWCPNVGQDDCTNWYPGDDVVDWLGMDGYSGAVSPTAPFSKIFSNDYGKLVKMAPGKPIGIWETACAEAGQDKSGWITQALLHDVPEKFPAIKLVSWFWENKECDWRASSSPAALAAYKAVASSPDWQGTLT